MHIVVVLKQFAQVIKVIKIMHWLSVNYTHLAVALAASVFVKTCFGQAKAKGVVASRPIFHMIEKRLRSRKRLLRRQTWWGFSSFPERCGRIILDWYFCIPFLLIMTQCKAKLHRFSCLSVIEVASGEYGENVIPSLVKAWKAREESIAKKNSLTSNTSSNMVVSMLPNCNVKTSTDSIIHTASQTTQVSVIAAEWRFKRLANNLTFAPFLFVASFARRPLQLNPARPTRYRLESIFFLERKPQDSEKTLESDWKQEKNMTRAGPQGTLVRNCSYYLSFSPSPKLTPGVFA